MAQLLNPTIRTVAVCLALGVACTIHGWAADAERAAAAAGGAPLRVLTDPDEVWQMSPAERAQAYWLDVQGRVSFVDLDPRWRVCWLEMGGQGHFVSLGERPPVMRSGQLLRIEGRFVPAVGLAADQVRLTILKEFEPIEALSTAGRVSESRILNRRIVAMDLYVDEQQLIDDAHLRLSALAENRTVFCWVPPDNPRAPPNWQGKMLRIVGLYSSQLDPTGTRATIELWVARASDVQVLGSIAADERFNLPVTPINTLSANPSGQEVHIRGRFISRDPGGPIILRDATGEVRVDSLQRERIPADTVVDAVGRTSFAGARWVVAAALYRKTNTEPVLAADPAEGLAPLQAVDQIRRLMPAESARGRPVAIAGVTSWSQPDADYFFLQDMSGGIRVRYARDKFKAPPLGRFLQVEGVTAAGGPVPVVELRAMTDRGSMAHPEPRRITFGQASSGNEDGQWVEMRGFLRHTEGENDWRWIYVTGPDGEFVGRLRLRRDLPIAPGALIRVRGVCETVADRKGRITGVTLQVPFLHDISTEEEAPADVFSIPLQRAAALGRLGGPEDLRRVRVAGSVVKQVPGHYTVIQDGEAGLLLLSRESLPLAPGDRIEAVGILGREGARILLREATSRRLGAGPVPPAVELARSNELHPDLDSRRVRLRGALVATVGSAELTRLTLRSGAGLFDAVLDCPGGLPALKPDSELEVTGLYKVEYDDSDQPHGFHLELCGADDVSVLRLPQLWTVRRALTAAAILGGGMLLVIGWLAALRQRMKVQTGELRKQLENQARLEAELERTQRFRSLGLLAGGIAHDFNNLLTGILGNATLAMLDPTVMNLAGECLRDVEHSAKRARDLTSQLVIFAKGGDPVRVSLELPAVVNSVNAFALSGAKSRADFHYPTELWPVFADRDQLARALHHLVAHASAAMPDGGVIAIEAVNEALTEPGGRPLAAGRYVRLSVADHGPALAAERIPGFFDPYSATKFGDDRFGMAISYSIIKRHGGHVEVQSQPGRGTTFLLWLPAAETAPLPVAAEAATVDIAAPEIREGTRILLMDDEETIRRLGEKLLRRMHCEPRLAGSGEECVRMYQSALDAGEPFDLVILDLTVPGGMGGREAIVELQKIDPRVRAIVSSGYSNDPVLVNHLDYGFRAVAPKPYDVNGLAQAIARALRATN